MPRKILVYALLLAVIAVGCGDGGNGGDRAGEPARGGSLVVAISSDPGHLNPAITTSGAVHTASELFYNGLLSIDETLHATGDLAESWTVADNGMTYTFTLRDGVKWHDGEPFTSADVKFSFDEALLKFHARTRTSLGGSLASIDTPDPRTVVFRFKEPYAPLLNQLDVTEAPIIPRHIYEGTDVQRNPANTAPIGTGPFRFVSYEAGSEIRAARNPDYFKPGLPYLDEVVQRVITDDTTQLLALESGDVDYVWNVPGAEIERVEANDSIDVERTSFNPGGANCIMTISFNLQRPVFRDVRVRQAVFHALDRRQFLDQILFGEGKVAEAPISSGIPFAHAAGVDLPAFDRSRAERLLQEVGWRRDGGGPRVAQGVQGVPDGTRFTIDFLHFPTFAKYGELVRQQLGLVGIEVNQRPLEPAVFPNAVFRDRDFDTNIISYCNGTDPEIGVRRMYDSSQISPVPFTNAAAYRNARVDTLFEQASQTVDRERRGELYRDAQRIVADDLPYAWVVETVGTRGFRASCSGFKVYTGLFAETASCSDQ